jgi:F-type H+-transporting ATPase subunit b
MSQGLERLGVHLPSLAAYLINFGGLLGALYLIAYRPFLRALAARAQRLTDAEARIREGEMAAAAAKASADRLIHEARAQAQGILAQADSAAAADQDRARAHSRRIFEDHVREAKQEIEAQRRRAMAEFQREAADLVALATEKMLGAALDEKGKRRLLNQALSDALSEHAWPTVRRGIAFARVTTAAPLTEEQAGEVAKAVERIAGRPVALVASAEPKLLGGMALEVGGRLMDASLRTRLSSLHTRMVGGALPGVT